MEAGGRPYRLLILTLVWPCWPDRTRFAAFLTSPPRFHDGGEVRNGLCSALCASGHVSRASARSAGAQWPHVESGRRASVVRAVGP
jgi:hypothetical protein